MADLSLVFDLLARDKASPEFDKVGDAAQRAGKKADSSGGGFGGMVKSGLAMAGAALVGAGIVSGFKSFYDAAEESMKISKVTASVIKSTGGAAGLTSDQVGNLATSLSNATGKDDEMIQSTENLLLTFTNVRNSAGKNNDVFSQASGLALDMATVMGGDAATAAMQLGKALNDPVKGVGALAKAGVSFTTQQKDQIAAMVKSGDLLGAQKIILGEVGKEFGGAAAAAATPMDRLKVTAGNLQEMIGGYLIPVFSKAAGGLLDFMNGFMKGTDDVGSAQSAWAVAGATIYDVIINKIWPALQQVWSVIETDVIPAFLQIGQTILDTVGFFEQHKGAAVALGIVVGGVLTVMAAAWVAQGVVATINAAKAVGAWFATATASTTAASIQDRSTAQIVVGWLLAGTTALAQGIKIAAVWTAQVIASAVSGAVSFGIQVALVVGGWVVMGVQAMLQAVRMAAAWLIAMGPVGWVIAAVVGIVALIVLNWAKVSAFTQAAWSAVSGAVSGAFHAVTGAVSAGIGAVVSFVSGLPGKIVGVLSGLGTSLYNIGKNMIQGLLDGAGSLLKNIGSFFLNIVPGWIKDPLKQALGINSPSTVFAGYGVNIGQGLIDGVASMRPAVAAELAGLANTQALGAMTVGGGRLGYNAPRSYDVGGDASAAAGGNVYHTTVSGVASPEQVAAVVVGAQRTNEFLSGGGR